MRFPLRAAIKIRFLQHCCRRVLAKYWKKQFSCIEVAAGKNR